MSDMVLCLNAGSASIKFEVFEVIPRDELQLVFSGHFEGIGFRSHLTALISCDRVDLHQGVSDCCNYRPNWDSQSRKTWRRGSWRR